MLLDFPDARWCLLECHHGEVDCTDHGPRWSADQLLDFCRRTLAVRTRCRCFGHRVWFAPRPPEHLELVVRLFVDEPPDPEIETVRPRYITPVGVSLAAYRAFGSLIPDGHPLAQDVAFTRWWKWNADLGLLPPDHEEPDEEP
jgi:hypothetical protein